MSRLLKWAPTMTVLSLCFLNQFSKQAGLKTDDASTVFVTTSNHIFFLATGMLIMSDLAKISGSPSLEEHFIEIQPFFKKKNPYISYNKYLLKNTK